MSIVSTVLDLLFPPKCAFCRQVLKWGQKGVCQGCWDKAAGAYSQIRGTFCARCVVSLSYQGNVKNAIRRFKFGDQPGLASGFGKIMARTIGQELAGTYDLISWIPVSEKRLRQRGYDQAMLLSEAAALELRDVALETLRKTQDNTQQSTIRDPKLRKSNVKNVYEATDPDLIRGKRILLIDDVITTGATMEEAARTLLRAGASQVVGAALARPTEKHTKEELL